jgi:arylformamidase
MTADQTPTAAPATEPWRSMTAAQRGQAYSPSSCIGGDYRPFVAAYTQRSAAAVHSTQASGARWQRCSYGNQATQWLQLCLPPQVDGPLSPAHTTALPGLLVFIHGGYWQELSATDSLFAASHCAAQGLAFAAINYSLAPQASVGGIVAECRAAVAWLVRHAARLGFDASNVVLAGSSAGAHLVAMVCAQAGAAQPRGAVLLSGIYDLQPLVGTPINQALGLTLQQAQAVSPAYLALPGFAPAVVAWGAVETDEFKRQSRSFAATLADAGTAELTLEVPGRNHFDVVFDLADPATALGQATLALFRPS